MHTGAHKHTFYGDVCLEGGSLGHKLCISCILLAGVHLLPTGSVADFLTFDMPVTLGVGSLVLIRVVLVNIYLLTNEVEHLFTLTVSLDVSFERCLFQFSAHF